MRCSTSRWIWQCIGWGRWLPVTSTASRSTTAVRQGASGGLRGFESGWNGCTRTATCYHTTSAYATNERWGWNGNRAIGIFNRASGQCCTGRWRGQNDGTIRIHFNRLHLRLLLEAVGGRCGQLNCARCGRHATSGRLPVSGWFHAGGNLRSRNHDGTIGQHGRALG